MSFEEDSLKYYEDYFQTRIIRLPHPSIFGFYLDGTYIDPPVNAECERMIKEGSLYEFEYEDIHDIIEFNIPNLKNAYQASGVRMADSPMRRISIKKHGAVSHSKKTWFLSEQMLQLC